MKYFAIIFTCLLLFLTGCNQKENSVNIIETELSGKVSVQSTGGMLEGDFSIEGLKNIIMISSNRLMFEELFTVKMPKDLNNRKYEKNLSDTSNNQTLSFSDKSYAKSFYVTVSDVRTMTGNSTDKETCLLQTDYNGSATSGKNTVIKTIGDKQFFITKITFFTPGNVDPYRYIYITHLCFVLNSIMYDMVLDNYPFDYANQIIDSFKFEE